MRSNRVQNIARISTLQLWRLVGMKRFCWLATPCPSRTLLTIAHVSAKNLRLERARRVKLGYPWLPHSLFDVFKTSKWGFMGLELDSVSSQWFFKSPLSLLHICILLVWLFDRLSSPGSTPGSAGPKTACLFPRLMMSSISIKSLQRKSENSNLQP